LKQLPVSDEPTELVLAPGGVQEEPSGLELQIGSPGGSLEGHERFSEPQNSCGSQAVGPPGGSGGTSREDETQFKSSQK